MIARHIEVTVKPEKYNEFKTLLQRDILQILKRQPGFMGTLEMVHESNHDRAVTITLWNTKTDVETYNKKEFPRILEMLKPILKGTPTVEYFDVEYTTLKFEQTIAA